MLCYVVSEFFVNSLKSVVPLVLKWLPLLVMWRWQGRLTNTWRDTLLIGYYF